MSTLQPEATDWQQDDLLPLCTPEEFRRRFGPQADPGDETGPAGLPPAVVEQAARIIRQVREAGDRALLELTEKFDGVRLDRLFITKEETAAAWDLLPAADKAALQTAAARIEEYHRRSRPRSWMEPAPDGGWWGQMMRPVARAGIYVPGGRHPYPSTVIMAGIPARVAGVPEVVLATPPRPDGTVDPLILGAAHLVGARLVVKVGGAQAIAALAYGTASVPRCDLVVGPGNAYVTAAKALVYGQVGIDGLMGPSEIAVVADDTADPAWVAADLAAQGEHGPDSVVVLLTTSSRLVTAVRDQLRKKLARLEEEGSPDAEVLAQSLARGAAVVNGDLAQGVDLANAMGPEHLHLYVDKPWDLLPLVQHAGAVYLGPWAPVAFGDYAAGPNHILPTGGTARYAAGLTVATFLRAGSVFAGSATALAAAGEAAAHLARREGLRAHADSLTARLSALVPEGDSGTGPGRDAGEATGKGRGGGEG